MTTMSSPPSNSDRPSSVFGELHEGVQKWIWRSGWSELRAIQELAARPILGGKLDVIISAATASGKTEAAFLPIASKLADTEARGIGCLCISPLKALINDQFRRLEEIFKSVNVPVRRWHGDVASSKKRDMMKDPSGLLIITPESLEAMFVLRGSQIRRVFGTLEFVVIDEFHAFIGSERGRHLQSLLHRIELSTKRRVPRIALSATIGDPLLAAKHLRWLDAEAVVCIGDAEDDHHELQLQVRGYTPTAPPSGAASAQRDARVAPPSEDGGGGHENGHDNDDEDVRGDVIDIAAHLFKVHRGTNNLIFANSRGLVEALADQLRRRSERARVPNEFVPHHGSLSKEFREDAEAHLKDKSRVANVVCTTTLELGIDVGDIVAVSQVGAPRSVASLRQRLGRSGRQGDVPSIMRLYITEEEITPNSSIIATLRTTLLRTVAMIELLLERWCEPPVDKNLHLSTLMHQVLSIIAQFGGVNAVEVFGTLCKSGPFDQTTTRMFVDLLRGMGEQDLITQAHDGELVLGLTGERIVGHHSFYPTFNTPEEYRVVDGPRKLGQLPVIHPIADGDRIVFAGSRWRVLRVDDEQKVIEVRATRGGRVPRFAGEPPDVDVRVRTKMLELYESGSIPPYLNRGAQGLLLEARENFERLDLANLNFIRDSRDVLLFPWAASSAVAALKLWIGRESVSVEGPALRIQDTTVAELRAKLVAMHEGETPVAVDLLRGMHGLGGEKFDHLLPEDLLEEASASRSLDVAAARLVVDRLVDEL